MSEEPKPNKNGRVYATTGSKRKVGDLIVQIPIGDSQTKFSKEALDFIVKRFEIKHGLLESAELHRTVSALEPVKDGITIRLKEKAEEIAGKTTELLFKEWLNQGMVSKKEVEEKMSLEGIEDLAPTKTQSASNVFEFQGPISGIGIVASGFPPWGIPETGGPVYYGIMQPGLVPTPSNPTQPQVEPEPPKRDLDIKSIADLPRRRIRLPKKPRED